MVDKWVMFHVLHIWDVTWDMTHMCVRHDSHVCDTRHHSCLADMRHMRLIHICDTTWEMTWHMTHICVTQDITHVLQIWDIWGSSICVTQHERWHDTWLIDVWLIHMCDTTRYEPYEAHPYLWHNTRDDMTHDSYMCDTRHYSCLADMRHMRLIHMCDTTREMTWDMTHRCVTHSYVWHN
jgi:hypothetical protein